MIVQSIGRKLARIIALLAFALAAHTASSFTVNTSPVTPANLSGLWWNTSESGWGINIDHQQTIVFATIFTYDATGYAHWYFASDCRVSGDGCVGDLYRARGGSTMTVPWYGAGLSLEKVGTLTLRFTDNNNGQMTYSINGVPSSKTITRMLLAPPAQPTMSSYDKTALLLGGTWTLRFTIISTFSYNYTFLSMNSTANSNGDYYAYGSDQYGDPVVGGYYSKGDFWTILDTSVIIDRYYVFSFGDKNHISGCYYQIDPPGSTHMSNCYPMAGSRYPEKRLTQAHDPRQLILEVAETAEPHDVDPTVLESYLQFRRLAQ
ncbi:MAG: hypothetical protein FIB05_04420 [Betaproteobacteria bacterium]|nr:hypothetical protein [Betaproteobacteria bacterium]